MGMDSLPSSSDAARKRMLADFVIKHKKQVVKTFAVVRWAKDARDVQKCMVRVHTFFERVSYELGIEYHRVSYESECAIHGCYQCNYDGQRKLRC